MCLITGGNNSIVLHLNWIVFYYHVVYVRSFFGIQNIIFYVYC